MNYLSLALLPTHTSRQPWFERNLLVDLACGDKERASGSHLERLIHQKSHVHPSGFFELLWYHSTPTFGFDCIHFQEKSIFRLISFHSLLFYLVLSIFLRKICPQQKPRLFPLGLLVQKHTHMPKILSNWQLFKNNSVAEGRRLEFIVPQTDWTPLFNIAKQSQEKMDNIV